MRCWVEYKDGRVVELDKRRLLKQALAFQEVCEYYKDECGVGAVAHHYQPYLELSLKGEINFPIFDRLPCTAEMRERQLPEAFHSTLNRFCDALEGRPAVYGVLDPDTLIHHREKFIKEKNGVSYILEYFEDE